MYLEHSNYAKLCLNIQNPCIELNNTKFVAIPVPNMTHNEKDIVLSYQIFGSDCDLLFLHLFLYSSPVSACLNQAFLNSHACL